jgi:hypothetical protein
MAAGDVKIAYAASSNLTVTNLHSIATSSTLTAGWESDVIDNTTNLYLDYLVTAKIELGNSATAGEIRIYVVGTLDDTPTYPAPFDGTESTEDTSTATLRDSHARLIASATTRADPGTDDDYYLGPVSVASAFGGICPAKFTIFIAHSTGVNLASSGNQVTIKGVYATVAQ